MTRAETPEEFRARIFAEEQARRDAIAARIREVRRATGTRNPGPGWSALVEAFLFALDEGEPIADDMVATVGPLAWQRLRDYLAHQMEGYFAHLEEDAIRY